MKILAETVYKVDSSSQLNFHYIILSIVLNIGKKHADMCCAPTSGI
jgi:hypothetical protein